VNSAVNQPLSSYIDTVRTQHTKKGVLKPPMATEMKQRWNSRIYPRKLHERGTAGANEYLRDYGNNLGTPKAEALAIYSEVQGFPDLALGFWKRAYELTHGTPPSAEDMQEVGSTLPQGASLTSYEVTPLVSTEAVVKFSSLPDNLQPGKLVTMQPVDTERDTEYYLTNPAFYAQPKRDGKRMVIFLNADGQMLAQKRSGNVTEVPLDWQPMLQEYAAEYGELVLDGEHVFLDEVGGEHRTGSQAAETNSQLGCPEAPVTERFAIFAVLAGKGKSFLAATYEQRMDCANAVWFTHFFRDPEHFEILVPSKHEADKRALLAQQEAQGREGVVFMRASAPYTPDKIEGLDAPIVRKKFRIPLKVMVLGLTKSNKAGSPFGAIKVGAFRNGEMVSLGLVGTGFTVEQQETLAAMFRANPSGTVIEITTLQLTERGKVFQGVFEEFRPDLQPQDCVLPKRLYSAGDAGDTIRAETKE
jgi:hypothetical protein